MQYSSITAIGALTAVNRFDQDALILEREMCSGLEMAELRTETEDAPGQSGILVFPPFLGGQPITLGGRLSIVSTGADGAVQDAMDVLEASIVSALVAMTTAADDIVWTGGGGGSLSVWAHGRYVPSGDGVIRKCQFGLIAGDVT